MFYTVFTQELKPVLSMVRSYLHVFYYVCLSVTAPHSQDLNQCQWMYRISKSELESWWHKVSTFFAPLPTTIVATTGIAKLISSFFFFFFPNIIPFFSYTLSSFSPPPPPCPLFSFSHPPPPSLPLHLHHHFLLIFSFLFLDLCFIYLSLSPVSSGIFSNSTSEIKELFISLTETTVYSQLLPSASALIRNQVKTSLRL